MTQLLERKGAKVDVVVVEKTTAATGIAEEAEVGARGVAAVGGEGEVVKVVAAAVRHEWK